MIPLAEDPVWDVATYHGCGMCDHGKTGVCRRPEVTRSADGMTYRDARKPTGPCGPDAYYLNFPGLYLPGQAP